jgi:hypothetical protein
MEKNSDFQIITILKKIINQEDKQAKKSFSTRKYKLQTLQQLYNKIDCMDNPCQISSIINLVALVRDKKSTYISSTLT